MCLPDRTRICWKKLRSIKEDSDRLSSSKISFGERNESVGVRVHGCVPPYRLRTGSQRQKPMANNDKEVNSMRRRADGLNLTINVNVTVDDGNAKKSKLKFKSLALILVAVILSVVVAVMLLLAVPGVDPELCAKFVRTFISTLLGG